MEVLATEEKIANSATLKFGPSFPWKLIKIIKKEKTQLLITIEGEKVLAVHVVKS